MYFPRVKCKQKQNRFFFSIRHEKRENERKTEYPFNGNVKRKRKYKWQHYEKSQQIKRRGMTVNNYKYLGNHHTIVNIHLPFIGQCHPSSRKTKKNTYKFLATHIN